jgi:polyhydroxyalkanoate synthase
MTNLNSNDSVIRMSDAATETKTENKFNAEAFAMNIARAMESSGQALAAYLKPREEGKVEPGPSDEIADMIKTLGQVLEYWLSDPARAVELQ